MLKARVLAKLNGFYIGELFLYCLIFFTPLLTNLFFAPHFFPQEYFKVFFSLFLVSFILIVNSIEKAYLSIKQYYLLGSLCFSLILSIIFSNQLAISIFGVVATSYHYSGLVVGSFYCLFFSTFVWLQQRTINYRTKIFLQTSLFLAALHVLLGIYHSFILIKYFDSLALGFRLTGTVGEANRLGFFLLASLPIVFHLHASKNLAHRFLGYLSSLSIILGLIATFSRGSWIITSCLFLLWIIAILRKKVRLDYFFLTLTLASLLLVTTMNPLLIQKIPKHFSKVHHDLLTNQGSVSIRLQEWTTAIKIFQQASPKEWLIGFGLQVPAYELLQHRPIQPYLDPQEKNARTYIIRNHYLETLLSQGIFGLLSFLFLISWTIKNYLGLRVKTGLVPFFYSWLAILAIGFIYYFSIEIYIFFWIWTAFLWGAMSLKKTSDTNQLFFFSWSVPFKIIGIVILCFTAIIFRGDLASSQDKYELAQKLNPWNSYHLEREAQYQANKFLQDFQQSRIEIAMKQAKQAVAMNPLEANHYKTAVVAHYRAGVYLHRQDLLKQALKWAEARIHIDPTRASGYDDLGLIHLALQDFPKALDSFSQALKIEHTYRQSWLHLGEAYKQMGKYDDAKNMYLEAIQRWPEWQFAREELKKILP